MAELSAQSKSKEYFKRNTNPDHIPRKRKRVRVGNDVSSPVAKSGVDSIAESVAKMGFSDTLNTNDIDDATLNTIDVSVKESPSVRSLIARLNDVLSPSNKGKITKGLVVFEQNGDRNSVHLIKLDKDNDTLSSVKMSVFDGSAKKNSKLNRENPFSYNALAKKAKEIYGLAHLPLVISKEELMSAIEAENPMRKLTSICGDKVVFNELEL